MPTAPLLLAWLSACTSPEVGAPSGDPGEDSSTPEPDSAAEEPALPPVGVFRLTEVRRSRESCEPEGTATGWGPYDRAAVRSVYGEEWEYWGWNDPPPADDTCVGAQTAGGACDPACEDGARCTMDGACVAWPEPVDAGRIEVSGGGTTVTWEPGVGGAYALMTEVPAELFDAEPLVLTTSGGADVGALARAVTPPARLDLGLRCDTLFETEDDLLLTWTPGPDDGRVRVTAREVDHGGGGGGSVICEGPDDGELLVPGGVLRRGGASRWWEVEVSRHVQGAVALGEGELRLELVSTMRCTSPGPVCQ